MRVLQTGFEFNDLASCMLQAGTTRSTVNPHQLAGAGGVQHAPATVSLVTLPLATYPVLTAGDAVRFISLTDRYIQSLRQDTTSGMRLYLLSTGGMRLYRGATLLLTAAAGTVAIGPWYWLTVNVETADAGGRCTVKVKGTTIFDYTGDTREGTTTGVNNMVLEGGVNTLWDDLVINTPNFCALYAAGATGNLPTLGAVTTSSGGTGTIVSCSQDSEVGYLEIASSAGAWNNGDVLTDSGGWSAVLQGGLNRDNIGEPAETYIQAVYPAGDGGSFQWSTDGGAGTANNYQKVEDPANTLDTATYVTVGATGLTDRYTLTPLPGIAGRITGITLHTYGLAEGGLYRCALGLDGTKLTRQYLASGWGYGVALLPHSPTTGLAWTPATLMLSTLNVEME